MAFLDELRRYLERPDAPRAAYVPDIFAHRSHVVNRLVELEKAGRPEKELRREHNHWTADRVAHFVRIVGNALSDDFAHDASAEQIKNWINFALDRELDLETSTGSKILDWEIERLRSQAWSTRHVADGEDESDVALYARRIRAVRISGDRKLLTPIGKLVVELPDKDALRWLLAAEVVQSRGVEDEWRLSRESAAFILKNPEDYSEVGESAPTWQISWAVLLRLSRMGIVETKSEPEYDVVTYALLPTGRVLLQEVASGNDTPFTILVQALLQDQTTAVIDQARPAGFSAIRESSADATARHARMVAHEIRNALVPVQSAVESLYRDLDRQGMRAPVEKRRGTIDGGIDRIFRFLGDISRIADLASTPSDLFEVAPAVQDAIVAVGSTTGLAIPFEKNDSLPAVKGHRDRFVLALVNVLRNAAQSRAMDGLQIRVSAGTQNGAEVFVAVDDNGPGVPSEHRASIFEPGFSLRPHGSGQGLALVREVIEAEMAGRAVCEQSGLGGARIVLRLPVGAKRNK